MTTFKFYDRNKLVILLSTTGYYVNRELYMAKSVSHPISTQDSNVSPGAEGRGGYGVWYRLRHVLMFSLYIWILNSNCIQRLIL